MAAENPIPPGLGLNQTRVDVDEVAEQRVNIFDLDKAGLAALTAEFETATTSRRMEMLTEAIRDSHAKRDRLEAEVESLRADNDLLRKTWLASNLDLWEKIHGLEDERAEWAEQVERARKERDDARRLLNEKSPPNEGGADQKGAS